MTDGGTSAAQGPTARMRLRYQRGPPTTGAAVETGSLSELVVMTESYGDLGVETVHPDFTSMSDERNELLLRSPGAIGITLVFVLNTRTDMTTYVLSGDDESVLRTAVRELLNELVGDNDSSMMVDEFDDAEFSMQSVVDAAHTPPFLTDRRVVVARNVGRFNLADLSPLISFLENPLDSTDVVLVGGGGAISKKLLDAVKAGGGEVRSTSVAPRGKDRALWVRSRAAAKGVDLDDRVVARLVDWMGENSGALDGILDTIASSHNAKTRVRVEEVEPLLGEAGGVPPWDLTDAIDRGDAAKAISLLHRMVQGGGRHPLQVMAILHGHYARMSILDGSGANSQDSAAEVLGMKSGFPAKKALEGSQRLGTDGLRRAMGLLADADLDVRGRTGLDDVAVTEVLVARLARLSPSRPR